MASTSHNAHDNYSGVSVDLLELFIDVKDIPNTEESILKAMYSFNPDLVTDLPKEDFIKFFCSSMILAANEQPLISEALFCLMKMLEVKKEAEKNG